MTFEKTFDIDGNRQLVINLPDGFRSKKKVRVFIEDVDEDRDEKISLLKKSSTDPIFLSDISEIESDFRYVDMWKRKPLNETKRNYVCYTKIIVYFYVLIT